MAPRADYYQVQAAEHRCDDTALLHSEVSVPGGVLLEHDTVSPLDQLRQRWENLNKDQSTKLQLSLNSLEQDQLSPVRTP